ncbi:hypothetical protein Tco_1045773 [Tanacetum coccineum]|uniref:Uncharacterized protein n=1 Tax=Tanacetum coccineum TaxID=301880 RepID=A0ABQ5GTR7_9ASTR
MRVQGFLTKQRIPKALRTLFDYDVDMLQKVLNSGYQQKDRKPSQNDKTEHGMEKDCAKSRPKSKNAKVRVNTEEISSHTEAGTEEYYWKQSNPFDGRESPIVISMKM